MNMQEKRAQRAKKRMGQTDEKSSKMNINWYPGHMANAKCKSP